MEKKAAANLKSSWLKYLETAADIEKAKMWSDS